MSISVYKKSASSVRFPFQVRLGIHLDRFGLFRSISVVRTTQLTKNVSGTFGFGCMMVWLNLTLLERNAYVRHWSYKCLVEPYVLKTLFKYSDSV